MTLTVVTCLKFCVTHENSSEQPVFKMNLGGRLVPFHGMCADTMLLILGYYRYSDEEETALHYTRSIPARILSVITVKSPAGDEFSDTLHEPCVGVRGWGVVARSLPKFGSQKEGREVR